MKFCISFGFFNLKYAIFIIVFIFITLYNELIFEGNINENVGKTTLLDPLLFYIGYSLCLIPLLIKKTVSKIKVEIKKNLKKQNRGLITYIYNPGQPNLKIKDLSFIFIISLMLIIYDFFDLLEEKITHNEEIDYYIDNNYFFIEVLIWFLFSKFALKIKYYKHQWVSFYGIMAIGLFRWIYIYFSININYNRWNNEFYIFLFELFGIVINSICYGYLKGLMEFKFISPFKVCSIIGIINVPIILIIDFIISSIPCNNNIFCQKKENKYYKIIGIFKNLDIHEYFLIIIYTFLYGISGILIYQTMNDFSFYHLLIPINIVEFVEYLIYYDSKINNYFDFIIILLSYIIEFLMYLIYLEIIELNFCGLNKNKYFTF